MLSSISTAIYNAASSAYTTASQVASSLTGGSSQPSPAKKSHGDYFITRGKPDFSGPFMGESPSFPKTMNNRPSQKYNITISYPSSYPPESDDGFFEKPSMPPSDPTAPYDYFTNPNGKPNVSGPFMGGDYPHLSIK